MIVPAVAKRLRERKAGSKWIWIGGQVFDTRRRGIKVYEAAFVTRRPEREIRNMLRRGTLTPLPAAGHNRVDVEQIAELIADDPFACEIFRGILDGRVEALRAPHETLDPPELGWAAGALR